ncbi:MAG: alpha/beta fold hydrolase [Planctomycetes bacterium]|nr:alpha/beta fold hydrolase [Planctomycetota bacterium]
MAGSRLVAAFVAAFVAGTALYGCSSLERELSKQFLLPRHEAIARPDETGLAFEEAWFEGVDGSRRHGWFVPHPDARGRTVLLCHGSAANLTYYFPYWELLHAAQLNVFVWDYAGYGRSEGEALISTLFPDARRAVDWLAARADVDARRIGVLGISLGSIVALHLAAHDERIACAAIEDGASPCDNIDAALAQKFDWAITRWLAGTLVRWFALPDDAEPDANAAATSKPLLFLTGELEESIDRIATERAFAAATGHAQLWVMAGTGHAPHGLWQHAGTYEARLADFFRSALDGRWQPEPRVFPPDNPPTPLRDLEPRLESLRTELVRWIEDASDGATDAERVAWLSKQEPHEALPPPLEAELTDLMSALGTAIDRADGGGLSDAARRWHLRALAAVPALPNRHWIAGADSYRVGFCHRAAVEVSARVLLEDASVRGDLTQAELVRATLARFTVADSPP